MKTKKIFIFALAAFSLAACRRGNDLTVSPNQPLNATPSTMLTGVEANTTMNYEAGMARITAIFMQYQSGCVAQSTAYDEYIMTSSDMDNYWNGLYVGAMKNAKLLYTQYEGTYPWYAGIAKINMAINLGIATELWGDVPYSDAFNFDQGVNMPHFDPQSTLLSPTGAIQTLLDQAIADLSKPTSANITVPGADDLIFGGNNTAWIKTAWTLKARFHNLCSNSDPTGSANRVIADLTGATVMTANTDNCKTAHNSATDPNQWASFQDGRGYNFACQTLIDSMKNMLDPRTPWYFDTTGTSGAGPQGNPLGTSNGGSTLGPYLYNTAENLPTPLVTYAESQFLLADAYARLGQTANAVAALNTAIKASVSDVTSGANTGATLATYTLANTTVHTIILEKWKAMFGQPMESYSDYRRTGFPQLKPRPGAALTFIPKRFPTDLGEITANSNAVVYPLSTKVWFGL
ncbi:MAG TPA: SusD/RagB family nutrient-binding outer membrane lipoprotein [Bacteroidia bacterium]|jgi:hypothetical protein|nr:SusD/RagB family nutrient-binding outer membrane lipoprotein [Bacteroidia bacterium]